MPENEKSNDGGDESGAFQSGMDRAKEGASSSQGIIDSALSTESERAAAERGFEAQKQAEATAEAQQESESDD